MGELSVFPRVLDVRDETRHEDKIELGVADDLVGDAVVAALRVASRRS